MANTPAASPPRSLAELTPSGATAGLEVADLLRKALEPSFILVRLLGAGGMGLVYLARDPALKRLVAVKVMSPGLAQDPEARARFQREAESVAAISHPNVVAIYAVGELANGLPYLVMQYVDGMSLADRLSMEGPLDVGETKLILGHVAAGLSAAHAKGVVHRDIKAANVLWDEAAGRALVTDFGIAAVSQPEPGADEMRLTRTGASVGTPQYMSPEQLLAERVDEKTDVYSLGLLGYELLAREGPFAVSSPNQLIVAHLRDAPRPISTLRADVDPMLETLLGSCLEKDAHARPTAEDVARRLQYNMAAVLEWPPPGLEDLQGAAIPPVHGMLLGGLAMAVPTAMLLAAKADSPFYLDWPLALALPALIGVGTVAAGLGFARLAARVPRLVRAAKAGYPWEVLTAVLVDSGKDMGQVIAGEREFATLSLETREQIRRWRIARAGLQLSGATWAIAGTLLSLPVAARLFGNPEAFVALLLAVPVGAQVSATVLAAREHSIVRPVRERLRKRLDRLVQLSNLAASWRASFERVAGDVKDGSLGRVVRRIAVGGALAAIAIVGVGMSIGMATVATVGRRGLGSGLPPFTSVKEQASRVARLRYLRPAVDPAISPIDAGQAFASLGFAGPGGARRIPMRPPAEVLPARAVLPREYTVFERGWHPAEVMRAAIRGFTPIQRRYLELRAGQPGERQVAVLARAGVVDWFDVVFPGPLPADMTSLDVPIPHLSGPKLAIEDHIARAALALSARRTAESERLLREAIGAGFALMDGHTAIENLVGAGLVMDARDALVELYEVTGRSTEAGVISADRDPRPRLGDILANQGALTSQQQEDRLDAAIRDTTLVRGIRWAYATNFAAFKPCLDVRQIVFGPDERHVERMAAARALLVRTPGEDRHMRLAERTLEVYHDRGEAASVIRRSLAGFAQAVDALTGSRRMSVCVSYLGDP